MSNLSSQEGALFVRQDTVRLREFLNACAAGDTTARQHFQTIYGEDIYNFPVKIYQTPIEEAGDFYLYVFERDRIFTRLSIFEGRKGIQFRTFLSHYVLKHLFLEWRRTCKEVKTISLQTPIGNADDESTTLEDILPGAVALDPTGTEPTFKLAGRTPLKFFVPEERLYLKLLSLLETPLSSEDICLLATISDRTIKETQIVLTEIQDHLRQKDEKVAHLCDELDSVWGWIVLRQNELHETQKQIAVLSTMENIVDSTQLIAQRDALENALAKRIRQRERLVEELRTHKLTTSYKDIARLLNTTVARVYSRIFRLREQLAREFGERRSIAHASLRTEVRERRF